MSIQTKKMTVKSDTALAETTTTIRDTVTFDVSKLPNGITYKGLKAVLSFADPIQWNKASTYDALTVVWDDATHASYASKRRVPQNIEITNDFYWLRTADLDAQVEMYRAEVQEYHEEVQEYVKSINANTGAIAAEKNRAISAEQTLQSKINTNTSDIEALNTHKLLVIGDSWVDPIKGYGNVLARELQKTTRATVTCMGYSGAGWNKAGEVGKTFEDLINEVVALPNHDAYDCVIMIGGINNGKDPESSITSYVGNGLARLQSNFKKVRYVVNSSRSDMREYFIKWQHILLNSSSNAHVPYSFACDYCQFSFYRDYSHLSDVGYCYLARYLTAIAYGYPITPLSSTCTIDGSVENSPSTTVQLKFIVTGNLSTTGMAIIQTNLIGTAITKSDRWVFPLDDVEIPSPIPQNFNYKVTDNYGNTYIMSLNQDNKIYVQPITIVDGQGATVNITDRMIAPLGTFYGA